MRKQRSRHRDRSNSTDNPKVFLRNRFQYSRSSATKVAMRVHLP